MQERLDFGPEFADHLPVMGFEKLAEEEVLVDQENPDQLRFFILDRFVEVK